MRTALFLVLSLTLALVSGIRAADKAKEVTLKGSITCAKCDLGTEKACATVIKVKEDGKDVVYFFDAKSDKANHKAICKSAKEGSVTGTVSEKDEKKIITVTKIKFEEKDK